MNPRLVQLLVHWVVMALGVTLATKLVDGISCDSTATLIVVVLLLSFFNAIIKPNARPVQPQKARDVLKDAIYKLLPSA